MMRSLVGGMSGKGRRALHAALVALTVLSGVSTMVFLGGTPRSAHAESSTNDVLLIHGFADDCSVWNSARDYLSTTNNWSGHIREVGYYHYTWIGGGGTTDDSGASCDNSSVYPVYPGVDLYKRDHQGRCDSYYGGDWGTPNQDIRNISCQLAWYIWKTYTVNFQNVRVVAHSMGGLIIRYALDRVQQGDLAFPPYLYVPVVITIATPHSGIPSAFPVVNQLCSGFGHSDDNCLQGYEMAELDDTYHTPNGNDSSQFMKILHHESSPPTGVATGTKWTMMGSPCDPYVTDANATNFPAGSGSTITHYIDYFNVPAHQGQTYPYCGSDAYVTWYSYVHDDPLNDYMHDTTPTTIQDASVRECDGCGSNVVSPLLKGYPVVQTYHSLAFVYEQLLRDVPAPVAVNNVTNGGQFRTFWLAPDTQDSRRGTPVVEYPLGNAHSISGGQEQDFALGSIYWSSATGTHVVYGAIFSHYLSIGGPGGYMGFPTSDEQEVYGNNGGIGRVSYFQNGGWQGGIYCSQSGSSRPCALAVHGAIFAKYQGLSEASGPLGFPIQDEMDIGVVDGAGHQLGRKSHFQTGGIYAYYPNEPLSGVYEVQGAIYAEYQFLGEVTSWLGLPESDEFTNALTGRRESDFQNGCITFSSGTTQEYTWDSPDGLKYC